MPIENFYQASDYLQRVSGKTRQRSALEITVAENTDRSETKNGILIDKVILDNSPIHPNYFDIDYRAKVTRIARMIEDIFNPKGIIISEKDPKFTEEIKKVDEFIKTSLPFGEGL